MKIFALTPSIIRQSGIIADDAQIYPSDGDSGFDGYAFGDELVHGNACVFETFGTIGCFNHLIIEGLSPSSQLARLRDCRVSHPVAAIALDGRGFYGQHGRHWISGAGNVYLSVYLPHQTLCAAGLDRLETGTTTQFAIGQFLREHETEETFSSRETGQRLQMMPCMAVYNTLRDLGLHPVVRYPNDIVLLRNNTPCKIAGCLTEIAIAQRTVTAARIGIGLNVAFAPRITDAGLEACCVHDANAKVELGTIYRMLLTNLSTV